MLDGLPADSITADQGAAARRTAIEKFRSGKTWLLVTTDLLARVRTCNGDMKKHNRCGGWLSIAVFVTPAHASDGLAGPKL